MIVRLLKTNDIEKVKKIYEEAFNCVTKQIELKNEKIYVLENNEQIIGMCMIDYINDIFRGKKIAYLNSVCIKKEERNKGNATYMLKEIEKICKKDGINELMLTSSKDKIEARNLYNKLEYEIKNTSVFKKEI